MRHTDFIECPNTNLFHRIQLACCASRMQRGICSCTIAYELLEGKVGVKLKKPKGLKKKESKRRLFDEETLVKRKPKKVKKKRRAL